MSVSSPLLATPHRVAGYSKAQQDCALASLRRFAKSGKGFFALDEKQKRYQIAQARMKDARTYFDWLNAANELDVLEGNAEWKEEPYSEYYDFQLLEDRFAQLEESRLECDVGKMMFFVRTTLARNMGDMGDYRLYSHTHTGTKRRIEAYIDSVLKTISAILSTPQTPSAPAARDVLESLIATRQAFGRTALLLSGGATFGMTHIGVVKALFEVDLLPRIICGASAGSIVAAVVCAQTDEEVPRILEEFPYGDLDVFEAYETPENGFSRIARFLKIGAWIDIKHLTRVMRSMLGDITFQEAYNRTRRVLNIGVSPAGVYELPTLLNYITAPNVLIWSAVAASCSVPFLFTPASLLAKDIKSGQAVPWNPSPSRWIDGSVDNDLPMQRLSEMFNVNHFVVSQVNPHVVPFLAAPENPSPPSAFAKVALAEAMHRMTVLAEIGIFPTLLTKAKSVLSQRYSGDITILPEIPFSEFHRMLKNPTPEYMVRAALYGERAAWPKLSRIRNHCAIELALDKAVHELRARVVFSPSMTDLRLTLPRTPRGRRNRVRSSDNLRYGYFEYQRSHSIYDHYRKMLTTPPIGAGSSYIADQQEREWRPRLPALWRTSTDPDEVHVDCPPTGVEGDLSPTTDEDPDAESEEFGGVISDDEETLVDEHAHLMHPHKVLSPPQAPPQPQMAVGSWGYGVGLYMTPATTRKVSQGRPMSMGPLFIDKHGRRGRGIGRAKSAEDLRPRCY